ncbi:hypothetical protein D9600_12475 [Deinococcus sp. DB0503]|nr:hypothetical protein [Deinococcus sp. DB0503]
MLLGGQGHGLIVSITWHTDEPPSWLRDEVSKATKNRLVSCGTEAAGLGNQRGGRCTWLDANGTGAPAPQQAGTCWADHDTARHGALTCDPQVSRHSGRSLDGGQPRWSAEHQQKRTAG